MMGGRLLSLPGSQGPKSLVSGLETNPRLHSRNPVLGIFFFLLLSIFLFLLTDTDSSVGIFGISLTPMP